MGDCTTVTVPLGADAYDIAIGDGLLASVGDLHPPRVGQQACLVTAEPLVELFAGQVMDSLLQADWDAELLAVPDGESAKTPQHAVELCRQMARAGLDRGAVVFALGGGVIGDLAGFAAAVYLRGVDFVQLPTTLLAQVDAAVGGKVAVDLPEGKNLLGAFHQPRAVIMDTLTLRSLPQRQMSSGLAEVIKHAAIADAGLLGYVEENMAAIEARDPRILRHVLERNCQIKADIVASDPHEAGLRAVLNVGHTIGHALEASSDWRMSHGEGVALGMIAETRLAVELGRCPAADLLRLSAVLKAGGLGGGMELADAPRARAALLRDKKIRDGRLRLPLITGLGSVAVFDDIPPAMVEQALIGALREQR